MKKLIVTAHDFGLSTSVNEGILYSINHKNNIITNISILPNAPKTNQAVQSIKKTPNQKHISLSLNTNFTTFKPLSTNTESLTDREGNFLSVNTSTWDFSNISKYSTKDIETELEAQLDWFINNFKRKPSALLSRKNEFSDPNILEVFVSKAKQHNIPIRTPVWEWKPNYAAQSFVSQENLKHTSNIFIGLLDYKGRFGYDLEQDIDKLIHDIKNSDGISELLLFPGFVDEELFSTSSLNWQRGQYISILNRNPKILHKLKKEFQLITFDDIT